MKRWRQEKWRQEKHLWQRRKKKRIKWFFRMLCRDRINHIPYFGFLKINGAK